MATYRFKKTSAQPAKHRKLGRMLGRRRVVHDVRIPRLGDVSRGKLPKPKGQGTWFQKPYAGGFPMLLNDTLGDCVAASAMHFLQGYTNWTRDGQGLIATPQETLQLYENSGYKPDDPNNPQSNGTDQGWYTLGNGGLIQYWMTNGFICGGELNKCGPVASVNFNNPNELQAAIDLFGYLLVGAELSQSDLENQNQEWNDHKGPIEGGHEFVVAGYEKRPDGTFWYDVLTWDAGPDKPYHASSNFVHRAVDEALVVFDNDWFNSQGIDPAGATPAQLQAYLHDFTGRR